MKMPFLLISPKIVPKIQLIKKGGCFEYHAVIADKIEYRYIHRASICPALGMDRRSFFMPKTMGKYNRLAVDSSYLRKYRRRRRNRKRQSLIRMLIMWTMTRTMDTIRSLRTMMQIAPSMKMIMNLCKQDRLDAWGSLRVAFTYRSSFSKTDVI